MTAPEFYTPVPNPDYGKGVFRRAVRLTREQGRVLVAMEDNFHGFRLELHHDGRLITGITGEAIRYPTSICPQAFDVLQALVGRPLSADRGEFRPYSEPRHNCTHLYDLAMLASAHALRDEAERRYDIAIPDRIERRTTAEIHCNGALVHRWAMDTRAILAPASLQGLPLFSGAAQWARQHFEGDAREAAQLLQICIFIAGARRHDVNAHAGEPATPVREQVDGCFAFRRERDPSLRLRMPRPVRDFTSCPEQLLQFR